MLNRPWQSNQPLASNHAWPLPWAPNHAWPSPWAPNQGRSSLALALQRPASLQLQHRPAGIRETSGHESHSTQCVLLSSFMSLRVNSMLAASGDSDSLKGHESLESLEALESLESLDSLDIGSFSPFGFSSFVCWNNPLPCNQLRLENTEVKLNAFQHSIPKTCPSPSPHHQSGPPSSFPPSPPHHQLSLPSPSPHHQSGPPSSCRR